MLDIILFRENPDIIRESQRRRFKPVEIVEEIIDLDKDWQERESELDKLQKDYQKLQDEAQLQRLGGDASAMTPEKAKLKKKKTITTKLTEVKTIKARLAEKLDKVGNLVHESVPAFEDEVRNYVVRTWQKKSVKPKCPKLKNHVQLVELLDIADLKDGGRGYYLKGKGACLIHAILNFALDFLKKKGYKARQTQYYTSQDIQAKLAQVAESNEELYKVIPEEDEKYLTATAELPLCGLHIGDWIHHTAVPIRYSALTPNTVPP